MSQKNPSRPLSPSSPCIIWQGTRHAEGYGIVTQGGRQVLAHRAAWENAGRAIPAGYQLHHICLNKACVNVEHLELVTRREHAQRHLLTHCRRGHVMDEANTYIHKGQRNCRKCRALAAQRLRDRRRNEGR